MYREWLNKLEEFKSASQNMTFEEERILIRPGDGNLGTIEIRNKTSKDTKPLHIFVDRKQAEFIVNSLTRIFNLV